MKQSLLFLRCDRLLFLFACLWLGECVAGQALQAQTAWHGPIRTIHGKVMSDSTLQPLEGATVKTADRSAAAITDASGRFTLQVGDSVPLVITYVGYRPALFSARQVHDGMTVRLHPNGALLRTLTVYTGYQKLSGNQITGAYDKIDRTQLDREVSTDIISKLEGKTTGLLFDHRLNNQTFSIRGQSTIFGNAKPLVILNDFPYEGDLNNINPNEVESITILKDAAATSIWGTRAGNGVVVIKTRDAAYNQPLRVDFSANVTRISEPDVESIPMMSSSDFIGVEEMLFDKGYYDGQINGYNHPALTPVVELLNQERNGAISADEANAQIDALKQHSVKDDFKKYLYQPGFNQQYFLTLSSGSSKLGYRLSGGYDHNTDVLAAEYQRIHLSEENRWNPIRQLEIHTKLTYTNAESKGGRPAYSQINMMPTKHLYPYARLADDQGNPLPIPRDHNGEFIRQAEDQGLLNWQYYPLTDYLSARPVDRTHDFLADVSAEYHLTDALSLKVNYEYEAEDNPGHTLETLQSYELRNDINDFTQVNPDGSLTYALPKGDLLRWQRDHLNAYAARGQVNYEKSWGPSRLTAMGGVEIRQSRQTSFSGGSYGYNPVNLSTALVDYLTYYPMYYDAGTTSSIVDFSDYEDLMDRYVSDYLGATYAYKGRYTLSVSARRDGSNLFGVSSNQRVVPLWSAGAAWTLSQEKFYHIPWLPYVKLRLTDGYSGNVDNMLSAYTTIKEGDFEYYTHAPSALMETPPNPSLRWEKVNQVNIGVDFSLTGDRITGSLDYYRKKANDLIGASPLDPTTGVQTPAASGTPFQFQGNVANMRGYGINLSLHSANLTGRFKWNTDFLFTYEMDKVTKYFFKPSYNSEYVTGGFGSTEPLEGKPLTAIVTLPWAGLDPQTGDPMGYLDGKVSKDYDGILFNENTADLEYNGPALPPLFGTIVNTFSYKGISLSFSIDYKFKDYFTRTSINYGALFSENINHSDFAKRWQKPGDEKHTNVPSMVYPNPYGRDQFYQYSSALISKGDLIRLRTVELSYRLPGGAGKKLPFRDMVLSLHIQNGGLLWKANKYGLDPEYQNLQRPAEFALGLNGSF